MKKLELKTILTIVNVGLGLTGLIIGAVQDNLSKEELKQEVLLELRGESSNTETKESGDEWCDCKKDFRRDESAK